MFVTGLQAYSQYGAEVLGLDTQQLRAAQATYLGLVGASARSASVSLSLLALGDPLWRQAVAPLLTWSSICWKAANDRAFQSTIDLPRLGGLAGPVIQHLPSSWGAVRGPLGAAARSMHRIGWHFKQPFLVETDAGTRFALTDTPPAMLSYHLQVSWARLRGRAAARSIGVDGQLEATQVQRCMKGGTTDLGYPAVLKAFITQSLWSPQRLHNAGYDVNTVCARCGAPSDSLHHRLFQCPATQGLRQELLHESDLDDLRRSESRRSLMIGFQTMPQFTPERPDGLGCEHQHVHHWTHNGRDIHEIMEGTIFTDGSCTKTGPPTWTRTGWAVIKMSENGDLLATASGRVGRQLPQTAAAGEYVAALVASGFQRATVAYSDYKNLSGIESIPIEAALHPKGTYSGIRRRIRGGMAPEFRIKYCKGHVDVQSCQGDAEAIFLALGNGHADRVAGAAAAATQRPSSEELRIWTEESAFLGRWLKYVPRALALWPSMKPSEGHKSLPRRAGARAPSGCSFASDVLGPWAQTEYEAQARPSAEPSRSNTQALSGEGVPPPPPPPAHADGNENQAGHDWHWQAGRWLCTACLSSSRGAVPRRGKCPGLAANVRKLLAEPKGHKLQIATFTDTFGMVVICSACGHYCTSNRLSSLHKDACKATQGPAFASEGAVSAYRRVSEGKHPKHAKGDAKVLEPCFPATALLAFAQEGGQPSRGPQTV